MSSLFKLIATAAAIALLVVPAAFASTPVRPDDRAAGPRSDVTTVPAQAVRPDDRPGVRGPGVVIVHTPTMTSSTNGFDFADAAIGAGAATGLLLVVAGGALVLSRRREQLAA